MTFKTQKIDYTITIPTGTAVQNTQSGAMHPPVFIPTAATQGPSLIGKAAPFTLNHKEIDDFCTLVDVINYKDFKSVTPPLLTSGAIATEDEIANISFFVRTLMPEAVPTEAMGITTGENTFQGFWAAYKSINRFKAAKKINDRGGMFEGGTDAARGISQGFGGASYVGYRGVMIAADIKKVDTSLHATTALGKAGFGLGFAGNVLFTIFYVMIGVWAGYGLVKDWQFSLAMKAHEEDPSQLFDFLMNKVNANPKLKLQKLQKYWDTLPTGEKILQLTEFKENLANAALEKFAHQYMKWQGELQSAGQMDRKPLTEAEVKGLFQTLFKLQEETLDQKGVRASYLNALGIEQSDLPSDGLTTLELIGFAIREKNRQAKREAKFSRVVSQDSANAVKKAAARGLAQRLKWESDPVVKESAQQELSGLKGKVVAENKANKWVHAPMLIYAILGIVGTILAFCAFSPGGAIAVTVITLILVAVMMFSDGQNLFQGLKSTGEPGRHDKKYVIITLLILLAAFGLSVGITLGFGLPLIPLIGAAVITGLGSCFSITAYVKLLQKEKKWKEDHPDLQTLIALMNPLPADFDSELDEKVFSVFKKLSKVDRLAIRNQYAIETQKGHLGFKKNQFKQLDANYDFGAAYMQKLSEPNSDLNDTDYRLFVCAIKKSVKFFWEKAGITKNSIDLERALRMQGLFERVLKKSKEGLLEKLNEITNDSVACEKLKNDIWFVAKRDESIQDLKLIAQKVAANRTPAQTDLKIEKKGVSKKNIFPILQRLKGHQEVASAS